MHFKYTGNDSLNKIENPRSITQLFIGSDVEEIPENCFGKMRLNLSSHVMEDNPFFLENLKEVTFNTSDNAGTRLSSLNNLAGSAASKIKQNIETRRNNNKFRTIGDSAFKGCTKLKYIVLPPKLLKIEDSAFEDTGLESIIIPKSIESLGGHAFQNCGNLETVIFEDGIKLKESDSGAQFENCVNLTTVTLANSMTFLYRYMFRECSTLPKIDIPSSVKIIDITCFRNCEQLESVTFSENSKLQYICEKAFSDCDKLTKITLPNNIRLVGNDAFLGCKQLNNITFNDDISNRRNLSVFENVGSVEAYLQKTSKPFNSEYNQYDYGLIIGSNAFNDTSVISIEFPKYLSALARKSLAIDIDDVDSDRSSDLLSSIVFEENSKLQYVGDRAFDGCNIKEITLPETVKYIGEFVFSNCNNLENVTFNMASYPGESGKIKYPFVTYDSNDYEQYTTEGIVYRYKTAYLEGKLLIDGINQYYPNLEGVKNITKEEFDNPTFTPYQPKQEFLLTQNITVNCTDAVQDEILIPENQTNITFNIVHSGGFINHNQMNNKKKHNRKNKTNKKQKLNRKNTSSKKSKSNRKNKKGNKMFSKDKRRKMTKKKRNNNK